MKIRLTNPQAAEIYNLDLAASERVKTYGEQRVFNSRTPITIEISHADGTELKLYATNKLIELQQTFKIMDAHNRLTTKHRIQSLYNLIKKLR